MRNEWSKKFLSSLIIVALVLSSFSSFFSTRAQAEETPVVAEDLFISEYIEGSSNNKAIEIFNGTGQAVDLTQYSVELYSNGASAASQKLPLTGSLANGDVYVIGNASASLDAIKLPAADITSAVTNFNGDDALVLKKNGTVIDSLGQVGFDPGTVWGSGTITTAEHTLVRKETVIAGDKNSNDRFDPSVEWNSFNQDYTDDLGKHTFNGKPGTNPDPKPDPGTGVSTIADAKSKMNQTVTIEGVVTADNSAIGGGKLSTYIQDDTAGINVFEVSPAAFPELKEGNKVKITGSITSYKSLTEIKPTNIEVLAENVGLPQPKSMTLADLQDSTKSEPNEGQLVKVTGFIESIPTSASGGGYNISFIDENYHSTTLRVIDGSLDVTKLEAGKWYDVTAILSQYNEYQLIPRKDTDLVLVNPQPEAPRSSGEFESTVASVVDGDTVHLTSPVLGSTKVRFVNIDTPETYHKVVTDADRSQKEHGEAAKAYLNTLLKAGDQVKIIVGEEAKDDYGRLLAQIVRKSDNVNTNLEMVRQGYAATYFIWPIGDTATYEQFQAAVKEAKDNGRGIWNAANPLQELPFAFRAREQGKGFTRYVGDYSTKTYVSPEKWADVSVENRVFFASEHEAESNGYKKAGPEDLEAPVVNEVALPEASFRDGSYLHEVKLTLDATDTGMGVSHIEYSLDNGLTWTRYENGITVNKDGKNTIKYRAADKAHNVSEAKTVEVTVKSATIENTVKLVEAADALKGIKKSIIVQLDIADRTLEKERKHRIAEDLAYKSLGKLSERIKKYPKQFMNEADKKEITAMLDYITQHRTESQK